MSEISKPLAGIAVVLGGWLIAVAVAIPGTVATSSTFAFWNYVLVGGAIAALSAYSWLAAGGSLPGAALAAALTISLGVWLLAIPFYTTATSAGWLGWKIWSSDRWSPAPA